MGKENAKQLRVKVLNKRVSEYYKIGLTQPSLNFIDVDIVRDIKLFISPRALKILKSDWGISCVNCVKTFFDEVLNAVKAGDEQKAYDLMSRLREPNETHLGLSKGKSSGRALGPIKIENITKSLMESKAVKSGIITDLEDTVLMIEDVSVDTISDMVTNIIRGHLIHFTQSECNKLGIPTIKNVASGPIWDPDEKVWTELYVDLPMPEEEKLLLIPKDIVRIDVDYDAGKYYRHFVLEEFKSKEINANSSLGSGPINGIPISGSV